MKGRMLNYDERLRVVDAQKRMNDSAKVAEVFGISRSSVYRLVAIEKKTGDLHLHTSTRGRKPKLSDEQLNQIKKRIEEKPDVTLADLIKEQELPISESRLSRIVREMGLRRKRKVMCASEQKRPRRPGETRRVG